jgi:hypothetical protein
MTLDKYLAMTERMFQYIKNVPKRMVEVRVLAKRYHVTQQTILDMAEDSELFIVNVAEGTHGGVFEYENIGDYLIEV